MYRPRHVMETQIKGIPKSDCMIARHEFGSCLSAFCTWSFGMGGRRWILFLATAPMVEGFGTIVARRIRLSKLEDKRGFSGPLLDVIATLFHASPIAFDLKILRFQCERLGGGLLDFPRSGLFTPDPVVARVLQTQNSKTSTL